MTDIVVVSYPDADLNEYFEKCRSHLICYIQSNDINPTLHGEHGEFTQESLMIKVKSFMDNYAVVIYSHGNEYCTVNNLNEIVLHEDDAEHFENAVVYSTACSTASSLGFKMSNYRCKLFFGYADVAYVPDNKSLESIFIETDNFALIQLLSGSSDCAQLASETDEFFKIKYDEIKKSDPDDAAWLLHNRESVRFYQNKVEC